MVELFLLFGFLVLMAMLWELKTRIQTATETTASALESQRLAIERRVTDVLEELAYVSIAGNSRERPKETGVQLNAGSPHSLPVQQDERPIFVATVFKSGTKLLEHIVAKLTGLDINAPTMSAGSDYESAAPITFENGKFFIWHNVPSDRVKARLIVANAQPIFLIRNIYDLAVSQYFHFAHDVDAEIGYATHTADYFAEMTQDEGISLLLSGATSERFNWHGFGYYLRQIQEMLQFSKEYPCHVVVYDRLVNNKRREIEQLAAFLNTQPGDDLLDKLIGSSSLSFMRDVRISLFGSGNHFRKGTPGDHINILKPWHYDVVNQLKIHFAPNLDVLCEELGFEDVTAMPMKAGMEVADQASSGHSEPQSI
jgi:hypothetical protein